MSRMTPNVLFTPKFQTAANNLWSELKGRINQNWTRVKPAVNAVWSKLKNVGSNPLVQMGWGAAKKAIPILSLVDEGINSLDRVIQSDDIVAQAGREAINLAGRAIGKKGNPFISDGGGN